MSYEAVFHSASYRGMERRVDSVPWHHAVAYRDRPPVCPRCGVELLRRQRRDIWRCSRCGGMQLASGEVERRLRMLAPDISDDVIRDVMTARRSLTARRARAASPIGCPACRRPMRPVMMGGVHV